MDGGAARPSSEGAAVGDLAAARRYVERVGLCLFQPAPAVGLPSLYEAVAGRLGPVGVARDNAWKYCFRYELTVRRFPAAAAAARQLSTLAALERVLWHELALGGPERPAADAAALARRYRIWVEPALVRKVV